MNKTGLTTAFPVVGLALVHHQFGGDRAMGVDVSARSASPAVLLWNGLFMGTVMGVVQVSVQSAAGQLRLGEAAASVQFSRSIGAAFGTALVATLLFAVLAIKNPEAAGVFADMVEHGGKAGTALAGPQGAAIQADIREAFRAAFLLIAGFTAAGFVLALTHPLRRI